jgi:hypothetical protein
VGFTIRRVKQGRLEKQETIMSDSLDPWTLFTYAMKAPMTRDRYQTRVAKFFNFIGIQGASTEEKARNFASRGREDNSWAFDCIIRFRTNFWIIQFSFDSTNTKIIRLLFGFIDDREWRRKLDKEATSHDDCPESAAIPELVLRYTKYA